MPISLPDISPDVLHFLFFSAGYHNLREERAKRETIKLRTSEEMGYILADKNTVLVSKRELTSRGLDPVKMGWRPLKLSIQPKRLLEVREEMETRYALSNLE